DADGIDRAFDVLSGGATLASLTIRGGYADDRAIRNVTALDIFNSRLLSNSGGALVNFGGDVTIESSVFGLNGMDGVFGGAISNYANGTLFINQSEFFSDQANMGGAIYQEQGVAYIVESSFHQNVAVRSGMGGAIAIK